MPPDGPAPQKLYISRRREIRLIHSGNLTRLLARPIRSKVIVPTKKSQLQAPLYRLYVITTFISVFHLKTEAEAVSETFIISFQIFKVQSVPGNFCSNDKGVLFILREFFIAIKPLVWTRVPEVILVSSELYATAGVSGWVNALHPSIACVPLPFPCAVSVFRSTRCRLCSSRYQRFPEAANGAKHPFRFK